MISCGPRTRPFGRWAAATAFVAAAFGAVVPLFAAGEPPPRPTRWVTDEARFLSEGARLSLDARLRDYETATGHQVLVYIGRTSGGVPIEDFAVRAFKAWEVGRRGKDDGLVLFIFADDRSARFEVGYGLEGAFPDVAAARVIREVLAPRLQAGDRDGGVLAAMEAATSTIAREEGAPGAGAGEGAASPYDARPARGQPRPLTTAEKVVIGLVVVGFLFLLVTNPGLALYILQVIASSGGGSRGGGWGGGGGGWSGGGGRSGGGGASGSW